MDIGYARVSTDDQDLTIQLAALERAGCDAIRQEKKSGKAGTDRPVRDQVLVELQPGDTLTVWKLDRLGRSTLEVLEIIERLDKRGIRFRCESQPVDTSTPMGKSFLQLLAVFAELERSLILERTLAGKQRRAAEGKHPGGRRLYGIEPDHETIVKDEAARLIEAAEQLQAGVSMTAILRGWGRAGIPAANGGGWTATSLRQILTNPRIIAVIGQQHHDAMMRLFGRPRTKHAADRKRLGPTAEHLLSGILRCGRGGCGEGMQSVYTGKKQRAYRCNKAEWSGGRSRGCGRNYVSEPTADRWAEEAFIAAVCSPDFTDALNRRQSELLAGDTTAEQLDEWRAEKDELETVLGTRFGTADMQRRHAELERIVRESTARLMARPDLQALLDLPKTEDTLRDAWSSWSIAERRAWLRRLLDRITVKPATSRGRGSDVAARLDPIWRA